MASLTYLAPDGTESAATRTAAASSMMPGTRKGTPKPNDAAKSPPPKGPLPNAAEVTDAEAPKAAPWRLSGTEERTARLATGMTVPSKKLDARRRAHSSAS